MMFNFNFAKIILSVGFFVLPVLSHAEPKCAATAEEFSTRQKNGEFPSSVPALPIRVIFQLFGNYAALKIRAHPKGTLILERYIYSNDLKATNPLDISDICIDHKSGKFKISYIAVDAKPDEGKIISSRGKTQVEIFDVTLNSADENKFDKVAKRATELNKKEARKESRSYNPFGANR